MEDWLAPLYDYVVEQRLPHARAREDYVCLTRQEEAAVKALSDTFSPEQNALFLEWEEKSNALSFVRDELLFRETFALARALYAGAVPR